MLRNGLRRLFHTRRRPRLAVYLVLSAFCTLGLLYACAARAGLSPTAVGEPERTATELPVIRPTVIPSPTVLVTATAKAAADAAAAATATANDIPTAPETAPIETAQARFRPPSGWTVFSNPNFVQGIVVHAGQLWAATRGGVVVWDMETGEPELFSTRHGLAEIQGNDIVYCPMPAERIIVAHPSGMLSAYDLTLKKWSRMPITFDDGSTLRGITTLFCDSINRRLIIGSRDGLGILNEQTGQWQRIGPDEGLNVDTIRAIDVLGQSIWIAAGDKSAFMISGGTIFPFNGASGFPSGAVNDLAVALDTSIWFGYPTGLVHYQNKKWNAYGSQTRAGLPFLSVDHVEIGPDRRIWIGSSEEGVCPFDPGTSFCATVYPAERGAPITDLVVDAFGTAYAATDGAGVLILDREEVRSLSFDFKQLNSSDVRDIAESQDGRLWIATDRGVNIFDPLQPDAAWETIPPERGQLIHSGVAGLLPAENGMWFYYDQDGQASFYDLEKWTQLDGLKGLTGKVLDLQLDQRGYTWFATDQGIKVWDGALMRSYVPPASMPGGIFRALLEVDGVMWVGTDRGLLRYHGYQWEMALPEVSINVIARDGDDGLLLGTDRGLIRFDAGQGYLWMMNLGEEIFRNPWVSAITWDANGGLWVGTDGDGLFQFDGESWEQFNTATGLPTNHIRALYTDRLGEVWIAFTTSDGGGALVRYMP